MFAYCSQFNNDVSTFDVSKVSSFEALFYEASSFNQDVSSWKTSSLVDLQFTFAGAIAFNGDISAWVSSAREFRTVTSVQKDPLTYFPPHLSPPGCLQSEQHTKHVL